MLGFGVWGGVCGLGFGLRVWVLLEAVGLGFRARGSSWGFRSCFKLRVGFWVLGFGFWVLGSGFWVLGLGSRV